MTTLTEERLRVILNESLTEALHDQVPAIVRQVIQEEDLATKTEMADGFDGVMHYVDGLHNDILDKMDGLDGRLVVHNRHLVKIEEVLNLRPKAVWPGSQK